MENKLNVFCTNQSTSLVLIICRQMKQIFIRENENENKQRALMIFCIADICSSVI